MSTVDYSPIRIESYVGIFETAYTGAYGGQWFNKIARTYNNNSLIAVITGLGGVKDMVEFDPATGLPNQQPSTKKVTLTDKTYVNSVKYPVAEFEADTLGNFRKSVEQVALKAANNNCKLITTLVNTNGLCYDGENFFDTTHPYDDGSEDGATQSNAVTATVVSATTPTVLEASKIIVDSVAKMLAMKDEAGDQINTGMKNITILVPTAEYLSAFKAAESALNINYNTNPVTGLLSEGFKIETILVDGLTGNNAYFIRNDGEAFVIHQMGDIRYRPLGPDSEFAASFLQVAFNFWVPKAVGYGVPTSALKVTLETATQG